MKKIFKILIFLFFPICLHAQNESDVSADIKRIFSELCSSQKYSQNQWLIGDCITDNSEVGGLYPVDLIDWQNAMLFNLSPCNESLRGYWLRSYDIIARSNKIITAMPGLSVSEDKKALYVAEAKFVRALTYFDLVTIFGGVPIYTDSMAWGITSSNFSDYSYDFVFKARSNISEVFAQIKTDLSDAMNGLPKKSELSTEINYYATQGAANALMAKMYLYQSSYAKNYPGDSRFAGLTQQWAEALVYAEAVINSGEYKLMGSEGETYNTWWDNSYLYKTTPGFRYMFTKAGNNCSESVFEVQNLLDELGYVSFTANSISQFTTCRTIQHVDDNQFFTLGWGFMTPTQDLVNEFASESGDAKKDPRFSATIGVDGDHILDRDSVWRNMDVTGTPTRAVCRKYEIAPSEYNQSGNWYNGKSNIKVMRYADVLLCAAEAALEMGNNSKALAYINLVRSRARLSGNTGYPKDLNSVTFNDIVHERRLELALEGQRFFDLVRWNLAYTKLNGRFNQSFQTNVSFTKGVNEFFPIPGSVMDSAKGEVKQNNGYDDLCAHFDKINDFFITPNEVFTIIDLTGKYSSNTFEEPNFQITSSNPDLATITLTNKKININYKNLHDGDTTQVTITMTSRNSQNIVSSFKIRVIKPLFTVADKDLNKVYTTWEFDYEIQPFYAKYGLDKKRVRIFNAYYNIDNSPAFLYNLRSDPEKGLGVGIGTSNFLELVKRKNLKSADIISMLIVLYDRVTKQYYAIDFPVKVSDIIPFISISRPQLAGNEISFVLSTTNIIKGDTSRFIDYQIYKRSGFRFNVSYDTSNLMYLGYNLDSSFVKNLVHDVYIKNNRGSIEFSDTTKEPIIGGGKLVTLRFKDLGSGLGTITANNFGFIAWYRNKFGTTNENIPYYQYGYSTDYYNILGGNDVIEIQKKNKSLVLSYKLYPNPATNTISINADFDNYSIQLYAIDGRNIKNYTSVNFNYTVPVTNLSKGVYIVKVTKDGVSQNIKLIKQ